MAEDRIVKKCSVFGEILFDDFGSVKKLGGAPFNVAYNLYRFGIPVDFYSAVGTDADGKNIQNFFTKTGFPSAHVKTVDLPTGTVKVTHVNGEPSYDIIKNVAYDRIDMEGFDGNEDGLVYCGSLAMRSGYNEKSFFEALGEHDGVFFDINLRVPHYTKDILYKLLQAATYLKLNEHELSELQKLFLLKGTHAEELLLSLADMFCLKRIYLTFGESGAGIYEYGVFKSYQAHQVDSFQDSVGAGDAFSSVLIYGILKGLDEDTVMKQALKFAAKVCTLKGALTEKADFYKMQTGV